MIKKTPYPVSAKRFFITTGTLWCVVIGGLIYASSGKALYVNRVNEFITSSGDPCTSEEWQRQYSEGRKVDDPACSTNIAWINAKRSSDVSSRSTPVDGMHYVCAKVRDMKFGDMSQNDLDRLDMCKAIGK